MSDLKTLKEMRKIWFDEHEESVNSMCFEKDKAVSINWATDGRKWVEEQELREEAKEWIEKLNATLEKACKKQEDGYYNDAELQTEGVIYTASGFEDDETQPIIKFIRQFFNLEELEEEWERESHERRMKMRGFLGAKKNDKKAEDFIETAKEKREIVLGTEIVEVESDF